MLTSANSVSYAFLLNLTKKGHKLSRIRVQTRRKASKVVADVSRVCGLAIIDVTDGVTDGYEESIVNKQVSDVNYQESLGDSKAARPMCSSDGTEFLPLKVPELMQTILSVHACSAHCPVGVLTGGAKLSL